MLFKPPAIESTMTDPAPTPSQQPDWIHELAQLILSSIKYLDVTGPIGYRWLEPWTLDNNTRNWVVVFYPLALEAVGGAHDGAAIVSDFIFDVAFVASKFNRVSAILWRVAHVEEFKLTGSRIRITGEYANNPIALSVFTAPPEVEGTAGKVNMIG